MQRSDTDGNVQVPLAPTTGRSTPRPRRARSTGHFWGSGFRLSEKTAKRLIERLDFSAETGYSSSWPEFWKLFVEVRDVVRVARVDQGDPDGELVAAGRLEWQSTEVNAPVGWCDLPHAVRLLLRVEVVLGVWSEKKRTEDRRADHRERLRHGVASGSREARLSRPNPPRLPPDGRAKPRVSRRAPVGRDEADRAQDRVGVSALCYRECRGSAVRGASA